MTARLSRLSSHKAKTLGSSAPSIEAALAAAQALLDLVDAHLPQRFYRGESRWRAIGAAMVVRMSDTLRGLVALARTGLDNDSMILLRALYEQVVVYCWIAIEPDVHLARWEGDSDYHQLRLHTDAEAFGQRILSRAEANRMASAAKLPDVAQLADAVDRHWPSRVLGFRPSVTAPNDLLNFRGQYVAVYRVTSRSAHLKPHALDPYWLGAA